uniref:Transmembrane protein 14C n=1 Tax=Timema monikensis TaxID=170555 RepID=A0A7R9HPS3_9NEOP|nr:unnamed protein product [Timema monikensis]
MTVDIVSFAYAASVAAGGIIGYVKAGSIPSLGAGLLFGSLLGFGAYQTTQNPNNYYLLLGTSSILGGIMGASIAMVIRLAARAAGVISVKSE